MNNNGKEEKQDEDNNDSGGGGVGEQLLRLALSNLQHMSKICVY
jgi:hypothetical protein